MHGIKQKCVSAPQNHGRPPPPPSPSPNTQNAHTPWQEKTWRYQFLPNKCTNSAMDHINALRAYSFCAVFLFRFINRNRNRRVQKERLSFERNNFHGNKMAHCLISNSKGKKYEIIIRERNSKEKYGLLSRQTSCLRRPRYLGYLLRSFWSVFESIFMDTSRKWRAVCCAVRGCGGTSTKVRA